jgi:hypothetical protein
MKHAYPVLIALAAALTTACASHPSKTEPPESVPAAKAAPAKESVRKEPAAESVEAGKPDADSMFARLKLGMTLSQVEELIGAPTRQWRHSTEKARIPYYFGPDRWVIRYAYKGEGVLTFNSEGEQLLTHIEVNTAEEGLTELPK